jgi:hypothetical protein
MSKPYSVDPADLAKVMPPGYRLVVWRLPFSRKFALTWWVDENGKLGRKAR